MLTYNVQHGSSSNARHCVMEEIQGQIKQSQEKNSVTGDLELGDPIADHF